MKKIALFLIATIIASPSFAKQKLQKVELEIVGTTDIHGAYFAHNYLSGKDTKGGMSRVMTFLRQERGRLGEKVLFLDNGDILQGQPTAYYYNYIDTKSKHLAAEMLNYMGCVVANFGNHDVETGHEVYDRATKDCHFPVLGANIINVKTGQPYVKPYEIVERDGVRIAFVGMLTPAIPCWLPENLWSGLRFEDMEECSRKWIKIIKEKERPDLIVGMFHAGDSGDMLNGIKENPTEEVAMNVPGYDVVFFGHDHSKDCRKVWNAQAKDSVLLLNAGNQAYNASVAHINIYKDKKGRIVKKEISGRLEPMAAYEPDADYSQHFAQHEKTIRNHVDEKIGTIDETIACADALKGPCAFMELIHRLQLQVSDGAQISIAAPLSMSAKIEKGDITIRDMFNLYKYENLLYTMRLTGREIKGLLEMSYNMWTKKEGISFNYDSAFGIDYTVDPTKPYGEMVDIKGLSDGTTFKLDKEYRVAINSYRGNGGGDLLTVGAGIAKEQLAKRIIKSTDKDLRYYLIRQIHQQKKVTPVCTNNWHFIPEDWGEKNMGATQEH